jgi:hypothetical protein
MTKQHYINSFEKEISSLFPVSSGKGLSALRESVMAEISEGLKAKKISDAKKAQLFQMEKDFLDQIYTMITEAFPEISDYVVRENKSVKINTTSIRILSCYRTIDSSLNHTDWSFEDSPFALDDSFRFETMDEMFESPKFRGVISEAYKTLERGKMNTQK